MFQTILYLTVVEFVIGFFYGHFNLSSGSFGWLYFFYLSDARCVNSFVVCYFCMWKINLSNGSFSMIYFPIWTFNLHNLFVTEKNDLLVTDSNYFSNFVFTHMVLVTTYH